MALDLLEYLSKVLAFISKVKHLESEKHFSYLDVRKSFFAKTANALRVYYHAYNSIFIVSKLKPSGDFTEEEIPHIENFAWVMSTPNNQEYLKTYQSILKLNLLNGCWVSFESSLDALFQALTTPEERERIELGKYYGVMNVLGGLEISQELEQKLKKKLHNKHVPINDKWNLIFSKISGSYPSGRDIKQDRTFLEFFGSCRNCMHNNSVSFKDASYSTRIGNFSFERGVLIKFVTPELIVLMIEEIVEIFNAMIDSIKHAAEVADPYLTS